MVMVADAVAVHPRCGTSSIIIDASPQVTGVSVVSCVLCVLCVLDVEGGLKFYLAIKVLIGTLQWGFSSWGEVYLFSDCRSTMSTFADFVGHRSSGRDLT